MYGIKYPVSVTTSWKVSSFSSFVVRADGDDCYLCVNCWIEMSADSLIYILRCISSQNQRLVLKPSPYFLRFWNWEGELIKAQSLLNSEVRELGTTAQTEISFIHANSFVIFSWRSRSGKLLMRANVKSSEFPGLVASNACLTSPPCLLKPFESRSYNWLNCK